MKKKLSIHQLGGLAVSKDRKHMAKIGRKGGLARWGKSRMKKRGISDANNYAGPVD